ncbi:MAG: Methyltransferase type 11 [Fibrobacteres bacterium]|nr:Methyltransferase type 11 [Fibrobacterota bacterium]
MDMNRKMPVKEGMTQFLKMGNYEVQRYSAVAGFFTEVKGRLLDVGCCEGSLKKYLHPGLEYHGADGIDNDFPNFAKVDLNEATLPYPDGFFDAVNCCATLEHLFYPLEMLREMKRVLKDDGRALISVPNDGGLNSYISVFQKIDSYDDSVYGHHWRFSIDTAREFFSKEFEILSEKAEYGPLYRKYLGWLKLDRWSTEWMLYGKKKPAAS